MRSIVILRGSPGSGKSTWIKKMNLEKYTLCADDLRLLTESPVMTEYGTTISQKNDGYVWTLLFELLEKRMDRGEFVIVDATHSKSSDFSKYNALCEKYRYRRYYVDFSDIPIEVCKEQNRMRESYKQVSDSVIDKMYARMTTQPKTSGWVKIDKNNFWQELDVKLFDFNEYEKIVVFGDIHGCYQPLLDYFNQNLYNEKNMYIFCGDYLDRGIQNKETLQYLMELSKNKNVLLLEGNHERWLRLYANGDEECIKNKSFLYKTKFEIQEIDKKDIRMFCRNIGQMAYFTFDNKKYFITHGGISYMPDKLMFVSNEQFIRGVGDYNVDIDTIWNNNFKDVIQIHAHRNNYDIDDVNGVSYNLEGKVEFGGYLKVLEISREKKQMIKIKNDIFGKTEEINEFRECKSNIDNMTFLEKLRASKDIRESQLDNNISSFNFNRNAFHNKHWNDLTTKSRGLFIDTSTEKVVARGYDKFFNVGERRETEITNLATKFDNKITCYEKYNGFLGIMSYVNDKLFLASKSSNVGEYANYFRSIYEKSNIDKDKLLNYLKNNDVSLTFEIIDIENDPHIIKETKSRLVLLDIIHNDLEFKKEPYEKVVELGNLINCESKNIYIEFDNFRDFHSWYIENTDEEDLSKDNIEGVVIESNGIMTKLKFPYYNFWKLMRNVKEGVARKSNIKLSKLYNATSNYFYAYLKTLDEETIKKDIITLREKFYEYLKD